MIKNMHVNAPTSVDGDYILVNGNRPKVPSKFEYDTSKSSSDGDECIHLKGMKSKNVSLTYVDMEHLKKDN